MEVKHVFDKADYILVLLKLLLLITIFLIAGIC